MEHLVLTGLSTTHSMFKRMESLLLNTDSAAEPFNASCDTEMQVSIV